MLWLHVENKIYRINRVCYNKLTKTAFTSVKNLDKIQVTYKTLRSSFYYQIQKYIQQNIIITLLFAITHQLEQILNHLKTIINKLYFFST